ncbi:MAG: stage II sporulation protein P [Firmicutes bacterium]|nr:stage II sporulation protein P [Bacillota bacterium]
MKNKKRTFISIFVIMLLMAGVVVYADTGGFEHSSKGYYVVYEEGTEDEVFATSWEVDAGDKYHSTDNKMYEVVEVDRDNKKAYAIFVEDVKMPEIDEIFVIETMQVAEKGKKVSLYFSHNAESYVPTDGTDSKHGRGGIVEVGEAFKKGFEKYGVNATVDTTSHEPHDANSYVRSRRTATKLLQEGPDAIFDIHRDAIPKEYYIDTINETPVAKIRIVLGRRNQNLKANEELARKIKAVSDDTYPGFVRDIFYARGNYNQDLAPRALLFEFGTHEHTRDRAENSAGIFAEIVTKALYGGATKKGGKVQGAQESSKGSGSGIAWLVVIAGLGGLIFLFLSTGGREFFSKAKGFVRREFGSFLARRNKRDDGR